MAGGQSRVNEGLAVENLTFRYGQKVALDDVSLSVAPGTFCALLGPNGAGKSTLTALLTRLFVSRQGAIRIAGHDLSREPRAALARLGVVFQESTIDLNLTVRQNLAYFAALHGLARRGLDDRIDAALARLGMAERSEEKAAKLNGGHRRRMELARALLPGPAVLLLDEPTVGLDAAARNSITRQVHDLADEGLCVLWATHLTDEVRDTDQLLVLHRGRIIASGQTGALRGDLPLSDRFLEMTGVRA
ncbi:ABC transporter ATP-binding protein [Sulfitobacter sp. LCG007]